MRIHESDKRPKLLWDFFPIGNCSASSTKDDFSSSMNVEGLREVCIRNVVTRKFLGYILGTLRNGVDLKSCESSGGFSDLPLLAGKVPTSH